MILNVKNLTISLMRQQGHQSVVRQVSMHISAGEMLGIAGESGSGKSITNLALMGLLPCTAKIEADTLTFKNHDLRSLRPKDWRFLRGKHIAMIFQNARGALNPSMKIKSQLLECIKKHDPYARQKSMQHTAEQLLEKVGLSAVHLENYPHELSGGMAQRVMIALCLSGNPSLLIADEPTTGLDPVNTKLILDLLDALRRENNMAIILVSHDLTLLAQYTQRMQIMYSGELMETGCTKDIMQSPHHPYTKGLIDCLPDTLKYPHKQPLKTIEGMALSASVQSDGCRFYNRCPKAHDRCLAKPILQRSMKDSSVLVNCHI